MERRKFTKEFKQEAVQLSYDSDWSIVEIAQNLDISPRLLYRWRSERRQDGKDV